MNRFLLSATQSSLKTHLISARSGASLTAIPSFSYSTSAFNHQSMRSASTKAHMPDLYKKKAELYDATHPQATIVVEVSPQQTSFTSAVEIIDFSHAHVRAQRVSSTFRASSQLQHFDSIQQFYHSSPQYALNPCGVKLASKPMPTLDQLKMQMMQLQKSFAVSHQNSIAKVDPLVLDEGIEFTSVLRKRRTKMNRHKLKKRRKRERFLTRKSTKE